MADQSINNNATINEVDPEDWKKIKCPAVPKPTPIGGDYSTDYNEDYS